MCNRRSHFKESAIQISVKKLVIVNLLILYTHRMTAKVIFKYQTIFDGLVHL